MDELKCGQKSIYASDFAKQALGIQEVTEIIQELELNQVLAEVTKSLHLFLTISSISAFCERLSSSIKHVNNYIKCFQSE